MDPQYLFFFFFFFLLFVTEKQNQRYTPNNEKSIQDTIQVEIHSMKKNSPKLFTPQSSYHPNPSKLGSGSYSASALTDGSDRGRWVEVELHRRHFRDNSSTRARAASKWPRSWPTILRKRGTRNYRVNLIHILQNMDPQVLFYPGPPDSSLLHSSPSKHRLSTANLLHIILALLDNDGRSTASTVADGGTAVLAALLVQNRVEGHHHTGTGAAQGMAQGNSTAVHVDLGRVQV